MATSSVILILAFCGLMIAASFGLGLWFCPAWQVLPPPLHW